MKTRTTIHEEGDEWPRPRPLGPPLLDGPRKRRRHGAQSPGGLRPGGPGPRRRLRPQWRRRPPASCPALPATAPRPWTGAEGAALITFHDGFQLLCPGTAACPCWPSIEEEEGSEASAMEINGDHPAGEGAPACPSSSPRSTAPTPPPTPSPGRPAVRWPSSPCSWTARRRGTCPPIWTACGAT